MFVRSTVHLNRTRQEKINASSKAITDHGFAIMQNPLFIGLIVFGVISAGAFVGLVIKERLPKHHLNDETKNTVTVSMAVVATFSALVLGLLISNANTSFSALGGEVTTLSAQILRLDQLLRRYGPQTGSARETLRQYAELKTSDLFPNNPADVRLADPRAYELLQQLEDSLLALKAASPRDKWWLDQAMMHAGKIGDTRWLLAQQAGQGTPKAFVALLVFWLILLFASFGLFAPRNLTSAVTLTLCAVAVAGAIGMILELEQGFGGGSISRPSQCDKPSIPCKRSLRPSCTNENPISSCPHLALNGHRAALDQRPL